jgi:hypothetical protein
MNLQPLCPQICAQYSSFAPTGDAAASDTTTTLGVPTNRRMPLYGAREGAGSASLPSRTLAALRRAARPSPLWLVLVAREFCLRISPAWRRAPSRYLPVRSRCRHPGQQQGRRWPSSSSSSVRRMRRARVIFCFASSTQPDELVAGQRRDVLPSIERRGVGDQRLAQVCGQLVSHAAGNSLAAHTRQRSGPGELVLYQRTPAVHEVADLPWI